jgi:spore maturation protein CgeB
MYKNLDELRRTCAAAIAQADLVILGSYVPDGAAVADILFDLASSCVAFYDIDTPVTIKALRNDTAGYLERRQVSLFDLYLSFTGGPTLEQLEREFGAQRARALYCSADVDAYSVEPDVTRDCDLGYLGTYSVDRQPALDALLIAPAREWPQGRFVIAGAQYPASVDTPANVNRIVHVNPSGHRRFYNRSRFTLNITRRDMIEAGYSPSVRLFEAAACGTAIISDEWPGLETILTPGREVLVARRTRDVLACLREMPEGERVAIGLRARSRVLESHTSIHRAIELEQYAAEVLRPIGSDAAVGAVKLA